MVECLHEPDALPHARAQKGEIHAASWERSADVFMWADIGAGLTSFSLDDKLTCMKMLQKQTSNQNSALRFRVLNEAYSAVSRLYILKPLLSPQDEETLAILIDKKLLGHLEKSMGEAEEGKLEPLNNILK